MAEKLTKAQRTFLEVASRCAVVCAEPGAQWRMVNAMRHAGWLTPERSEFGRFGYAITDAGRDALTNL